MIVILAIGLSLSTSQAVAADFSVIGVGENSCGKWTENKKSNEIYYEMQQTWVLGFASGVGSTHLKGMDPLAGLDAYAVAGWVDNYCRRNPLNNIATAAIEFIKIHPH